MKLTVELSDPKYCNGCPCRVYSFDTRPDFCQMFKKNLGNQATVNLGEAKLRLKECVEENGA